MRQSIVEQTKKSADDLETFCAMSLNESLKDLSFGLKKHGVRLDAVAMCTAHVREHSDRTFTFLMSEYRTCVGDLASRVEKMEALLDSLEAER